ncbi:MAG: diphthine--ammonia ligase [Candidatus Aenigmarchaeota archaeon]|nr:diphthine--ammonia ligase [Candidatus Aenigmarchaeota archaeon]
MKVAVLFSGGKDSTLAAKYCIDRGWDVTLVSVKPPSVEAYIWHYPTVELTKLSAQALGLPHIYVECPSIGPEEEASVLEGVFAANGFDAVVLGGVGLQETQIREVKETAKKYGMQTIVPYAHLSSEELLKLEIESGLDIMLTEVAAGGLTRDLLGRRIDEGMLGTLQSLSSKHGFDALGEGGAYNTFVCDAPFFSAKVAITDSEIRWDEKTRSGYVVAQAKLVKKVHNVLV